MANLDNQWVPKAVMAETVGIRALAWQLGQSVGTKRSCGIVSSLVAQWTWAPKAGMAETAGISGYQT